MDAMIDLETFGLGPTAAIVQVGAVAFDPMSDAVGPRHFERAVTLQSSLLLGLTVDQGTVAWWRGQPAETQAILSVEAVPLRDALALYAEWHRDNGIEQVWSHGAAFDIPLLEHAYRLMGHPTPWSYRNVRDTRTVFWLAQQHGWEPTMRAVAHTAKEDALAQAKDVQSALAHLREGLV